MSVIDMQPVTMEFTAEDFDAYQEEKWNSNMFTLPRRKVKEKLGAMGQILAEELTSKGLSLVMHLSDEFPSLWNKKSVSAQWLFFSRDEAAREELTDLIDTERRLAATLADPTPRFRQVFMGVSVNRNHFEIGLRLHYNAWVDRRNLLNHLETAEGRETFKRLLGELPEHYEMELTDEESVSPPSFDDAGIDTILKSFSREREWLFVGARMPADQVPVLGADVVDTACEIFRTLIPVYRFWAWSPDNDAISLDELVAKRNQAIQASREEYDRERAEREAKHRENEETGLRLREEIEERVRQTQAWRQREIAARRFGGGQGRERSAAGGSQSAGRGHRGHLEFGRPEKGHSGFRGPECRRKQAPGS